ncbi:MAG TPA: DUF4832 domain-containing protein [Bacteroidales bacterium]|nr:DUF4832 domain-containing protein [Bacteroidales bacterium]
MHSLKIKILVGLVLALGISDILNAQQLSFYTYTQNDSVFANPERGFYRYTERNSSTGTLDAETLKSYRESGYTLIYRIFYLYDYVNTPISEAYLNKIREDFSKIREAGIKAIVRFAYTASMAAPYGDATPDQVKKHIAQLKPILTDNSDVIFIVQAGFIGAWGEWYYTDHFATGSPNNITAADLQERRDLVNSLLDAVPADRMIQLRYVGYKMSIFDSIPVTADEAYSGTPKSRISHHNDCFVSSENDVGSYRNIRIEKQYLEKDSKYTTLGGETCDWFPPRSNCDTSVSEMQRFHWTFINHDYYGPIINEWQQNGCYNDMLRNLGYRYSLVDAEIQDSARQNGSFKLKFNLQNSGYSNPVNPRNAEVVLKNKTTGQLYFSRINYEIRKKELNVPFEISAEVGIPSFMAEGDYDVYLSLPDPRYMLRFNPDYSIRLANNYLWNNSLGMNRLNHTLHINQNASGNDYSGENYFSSYSIDQNANIPSPSIYVTSYCRNAIISLAPQTGDSASQVIVERSTDPLDDFTILATLSGLSGNISFSDNGLSENTHYYYRAYRLIQNERSEYSQVKNIVTADCNYRYPEISVNADENDWNAVVPSAGISSEGKDCFLKLHNTSDGYLDGILSGDSIIDFSIYFNTDENLNTGENPMIWSSSGFDFKLTKDGLFRYVSGNFEPVAAIDSLAINEHALEFKIPVTMLESNNQVRKVFCAVIIHLKDRDLYIPFEGKPSTFYEFIPAPARPANLSVRNSVNSPASKLIVKWDKCADCVGYVLTRTDKSNNSDTVFNLQVNDNQLIDSPLKEETVYEYTVYSYNFSGLSEIAGPVVQSTLSTGTDEVMDQDMNFTVYTKDREIFFVFNTTRNLPERVSIFSVDGKLVMNERLKMTGKNTGNIKMPSLPRGVYIIRLNTGNTVVNKKIII